MNNNGEIKSFLLSLEFLVVVSVHCDPSMHHRTQLTS
jgi:hypothetical protein